MLLTAVPELPRGWDWMYEPKLDGYRTIGEVALGGARLTSRRGTNFTSDYPGVSEQLPDAFSGHSVVVDGELVGLDAAGRESFGELRKRRNARAVYYIFDLLEVNDESIVRSPLRERRRRLEGVFRPQANVQLVTQYSAADLPLLLRVARRQGFEGVVAKRLDSTYKPGKRDPSWLKYKFPGRRTDWGRA